MISEERSLLPDTFGAMVKAARRMRGISVQEMAARLGAGPSTVSLIENGRMKPPKADRARAWAQALGIGEERAVRAAAVGRAVWGGPLGREIAMRRNLAEAVVHAVERGRCDVLAEALDAAVAKMGGDASPAMPSPA